MSCSTQLDKEQSAASTPERQAGVLVARRHHLLVRCSHWLNVPILLGLILSGVSIYWASPVYQHKPDPVTGISILLRTSVSGYARMCPGCTNTALRLIGSITT